MISEETRLSLREYLAFRHHTRHAYAHHLEWLRMKNLVLRVSDTWDQVQAEIRRIIEVQSQMSNGDEGG